MAVLYYVGPRDGHMTQAGPIRFSFLGNLDFEASKMETKSC